MVAWGSPEEVERRRRVRLALWAFAYEFKDESLVPDAVFDEEAMRVDPSVSTGHAVLDTFFRTVYTPHSGQWIHEHPELERVEALYERRRDPAGWRWARDPGGGPMGHGRWIRGDGAEP